MGLLWRYFLCWEKFFVLWEPGQQQALSSMIDQWRKHSEIKSACLSACNSVSSKQGIATFYAKSCTDEDVRSSLLQCPLIAVAGQTASGTLNACPAPCTLPLSSTGGTCIYHLLRVFMTKLNEDKPVLFWVLASLKRNNEKRREKQNNSNGHYYFSQQVDS